jgi:hypothetical protein
MAVQFLLEIFAGVLQIPGHNPHSVVGVGSTRFRCSGKRSKEGDAGIKCASRTGGASWPNVMIEVGFSAPLKPLRMDARWWLESSSSLTKMVILALVASSLHALHIEV